MDGKRIRDLITSALGQGGWALLSLLYLRMAVRGLSPEAYGVSSAWLGTNVLLRGLLLLPLLQLLMYRFHEQEAEHQGRSFSRAILRGLLLGCVLMVGLAFLGLALFPPTASRWFVGGALVGLLGLAEGMKSFALNHLNLREKHGIYAAATLGDAGLRLLLLWWLLPHMGGDPAILLVVPILGSTAITLLVSRSLWQTGKQTAAIPSLLALCRAHGAFLGPILIIAVTSWVTGLADRYFLLHWAGKAETGRYAAVYGLFGTPFTLLVATLVLVFRPRLSLHASAPEGRRAYRVTYRQFFLLGSGGTLALAATLWFLRHPLGHLMLRPEHEALFPMLPFLLSGQVFLAVGQLFEQEFYIQRRMAFIVIKQCVGFTAALGLMVLLIPSNGIWGAMVACAGYYGIECLSGLVLFAWHRTRSPMGHLPECAGAPFDSSR
jgi:O-antigen/teichoic acid export membrane protein